MSSNSLSRQLNISLITDTPNPIIDFFNSIWSKLSIVETDVYHDNGGEFIYFIDDEPKQWIFFQDNKNKKFWCDLHHYWSLFEVNFNLNYGEIQELTKLLVENALNNGVSTPRTIVGIGRSKVENALNNGVSTPRFQSSLSATPVENTLNNGVSTPVSKYFSVFPKVENALNNGVSTPEFDFSSPCEAVENALINGISTPRAREVMEYEIVENALINGISTPIKAGETIKEGVENALNNVITTPEESSSFLNQQVEYVLNNITPFEASNARQIKIENALNNDNKDILIKKY